MAEEDLESLRQAWRVARSVETKVAYLAASLRSGQLGKKRLRLALALGDEAAARVLGRAETPAELGLAALVKVIGTRGRGLCVRAAVAAAEACRPIWKKAHPADARFDRTLEIARQWLETPSNQAADPYEDSELVLHGDSDVFSEPAAAAVAFAAVVQASPKPLAALEDTLSEAITAQGENGEDLVKQAVASTLIAWALELD